MSIETIRASPFFRAARNNSGYPVLPDGPKRFGLPEFFKPLETNSSYPDFSGRPNFTGTRLGSKTESRLGANFKPSEYSSTRTALVQGKVKYECGKIRHAILCVPIEFPFFFDAAFLSRERRVVGRALWPEVPMAPF